MVSLRLHIHLFMSFQLFLTMLVSSLPYFSSQYFIFKAESYFVVFVYHILFIHPSSNGHLGCFHLWAIVNDAAVNVHVQNFVRIPVFNFFGYIPSCGIAGSYSYPLFNILRNHQYVFHSGHIILRYHQQCTRCLNEVDLIVVFTCISITTNDEHFSMCLLAICISSFWRNV